MRAKHERSLRTRTAEPKEGTGRIVRDLSEARAKRTFRGRDQRATPAPETARTGEKRLLGNVCSRSELAFGSGFTNFERRLQTGRSTSPGERESGARIWSLRRASGGSPRPNRSDRALDDEKLAYCARLRERTWPGTCQAPASRPSKAWRSATGWTGGGGHALRQCGVRRASQLSLRIPSLVEARSILVRRGRGGRALAEAEEYPGAARRSPGRHIAERSLSTTSARSASEDRGAPASGKEVFAIWRRHVMDEKPRDEIGDPGAYTGRRVAELRGRRPACGQGAPRGRATSRGLSQEALDAAVGRAKTGDPQDREVRARERVGKLGVASEEPRCHDTCKRGRVSTTMPRLRVGRRGWCGRERSPGCRRPAWLASAAGSGSEIVANARARSIGKAEHRTSLRSKSQVKNAQDAREEGWRRDSKNWIGRSNSVSVTTRAC